MKCPNCGTVAAPGERFCGNCGQALPDATATQPLVTPLSGPPPPPAPYVSPGGPPAYPAASSGPPPYVPPPAPTLPPSPPVYGGTAMTQQRDPQTAMIIEIIAGLFGFLGIGHFYAGRTNIGLGLLIGWWVFLIIEFVLFAFVIGLCLLPLNLIVPIVSGMWVRNELLGQPTNIAGINLGSIK